MPFTGRPNVTDAERKKMMNKAYPNDKRYWLYEAIRTKMEKFPELKALMLKTEKTIKPDSAFDKWNKENRHH